jgi:rubredoxin
MSFRLETIGGFNPFEWDALKCPVCGKNDFISLSHTAVYCDYCNARFVVRHTCGDPGCVVDCIVKEEHRGIYAPKYECLTCDITFGSLDEQPKCPNDPEHRAERVMGIFTTLKLPEDFPEAYYLILKLGDYCSSWMESGNIGNRLDHPTEEQWDEFQKTLEEPEVIVLPRAIIVK